MSLFYHKLKNFPSLDTIGNQQFFFFFSEDWIQNSIAQNVFGRDH